MPYNQVRVDDYNKPFSTLRHNLVMIVATLIFWLIMLGLLTIPVWLPGLVTFALQK
jgi:hypothetical protein